MAADCHASKIEIKQKPPVKFFTGAVIVIHSLFNPE
jgi:hypothetical protein